MNPNFHIKKQYSSERLSGFPQAIWKVRKHHKVNSCSECKNKTVKIWGSHMRKRIFWILRFYAMMIFSLCWIWIDRRVHGNYGKVFHSCVNHSFSSFLYLSDIFHVYKNSHYCCYIAQFVLCVCDCACLPVRVCIYFDAECRNNHDPLKEVQNRTQE